MCVIFSLPRTARGFPSEQPSLNPPPFPAPSLPARPRGADRRRVRDRGSAPRGAGAPSLPFPSPCPAGRVRVCVCARVCACVPGCLPRASRERRRCPLIPALVLVRGRQERGAALGTAAPAPAPARRPPAGTAAPGRWEGARREPEERARRAGTSQVHGRLGGREQRERARGESPRRWLPGSRLQPPLPRRRGEARPGWRLPRGARLCACPRPPSRSYLISR